jgi:hypothetical protein
MRLVAGLRDQGTVQAARDHRAAPTTPWLGLGLALFGYAALVAVLVQFVVLPYLFPAFHAGHGLLVGGDWIAFHRLAAETAAAIATQGWGAWALRPEGQAPAGIAAAVYAVTVPEPWTMIPVNAALHAGAALVLLRLVLRFVPDWRLALGAVLPFFLYPSALAWYTQNHKDSYFIAGFYLLLNAWVVLAGSDGWASVRWRLVEAVGCAVAGAALVGLVRPHGVQVFQGLAAVATVGLSALYVARVARGAWPWRQAAVVGAMAWGLVVGLTPFTLGGVVDRPPPERPGPPAVLDAGAREPAATGAGRLGASESPVLMPVAWTWSRAGAPPSAVAAGVPRSAAAGPHYRVEQPVGAWALRGYAVDVARLLEDRPAALALDWQLPPGGEGSEGADFAPGTASATQLADEMGTRRWQASGWLPAAVEARLYTMAEIRRGFLEYYREAASNIDGDVAFTSAADFATYVPRALQIGLLAPFPAHWFERGHIEATTLQRRVTGVEMVGVYLALAALPYAVWRWRRRAELWVLLGLCLGLVLVLAVVTPNVGSLHRARYGPLMALVALGLAGGTVALWERRTGLGSVVPNVSA